MVCNDFGLIGRHSKVQKVKIFFLNKIISSSVDAFVFCVCQWHTKHKNKTASSESLQNAPACLVSTTKNLKKKSFMFYCQLKKIIYSPSKILVLAVMTKIPFKIILVILHLKMFVQFLFYLMMTVLNLIDGTSRHPNRFACVAIIKVPVWKYFHLN